jgi:hypothetical protein
LFSFVQIRGSIPIFWSQPETWKLKPAIKVQGDETLHGRALKTHLLELARHYTPGTAPAEPSAAAAPGVTMINLIDKSGGQGQLGQWLVAAFHTVERGVVSAFPAHDAAPEPEHPTGTETGGKAPASAAAAASAAATAAGALPYRVARDASLRNRRAVTQTDYKCPLSSSDVDRASPTPRIRGRAGTDPAAAPTTSQLRDDLSHVSSGLPAKTAPRAAPGAVPALLVRFVWFDYHKKCKGGNVDALKELYPAVRGVVGGGDGYFELPPVPRGGKQAPERSPTRLQRGVLRTNCVDCLDRTNVVQVRLTVRLLIAVAL